MVVSGNYQVVLDACVLAPPVLCDLFLRLAETPRLYLPRWSDAILDEVKKTQVSRLGFPDGLAESWRREVTRTVPEALVEDYELYIAECENDPKDRHVLAAAIRSNCSGIVTANLKDFTPTALRRWKIEAVSPSSFLLSLYGMRPAVVTSKLDDMAQDRKLTRAELLVRVYKSAPAFANRIASELEIDLTVGRTTPR